MKVDPKEITGIILIDKVLEFIAMTSNPSDWNLAKQKDNEPRLFRLQQLNVLFELFFPESYNLNDMKGNIESVLNGNFISQRKAEMYCNLFIQMDKLIENSKYNFKKEDEWRISNLRHNYRELIEYKIKLRKVMEFNSGIMEISYPYLYSVIVSNNISDRINNKILDDFLWTVVDPTKTIYKKETLIKYNNYPEEDVYNVDLDWW